MVSCDCSKRSAAVIAVKASHKQQLINCTALSATDIIASKAARLFAGTAVNIAAFSAALISDRTRALSGLVAFSSKFALSIADADLGSSLEGDAARALGEVAGSGRRSVAPAAELKVLRTHRVRL